VTTPAGLPDGPRRDGLVLALDAVRSVARAQASQVLTALPDAGDVTTSRAVDDLVEQAADALRALDEVVTRTVQRLGAAGAPAPRPPVGPHTGAFPTGHTDDGRRTGSGERTDGTGQP
jgi:hypothetical protein